MSLAGLDTELKDYRLVNRLAIGGMAEVFVAETLGYVKEHPKIPVLIKRLLPQYRSHEAYIRLFLNEARLCVRLRHKNIVRTYKAFKKGADYYMVQELVEGASLATVMHRLRRRKLWSPPPATLEIIISLLQALDYIHRAKLGDQYVHLVHRDVHPGNIMVGFEGQVKLTDFGVAEGEGIGAEKVRGALRGTAPYMSPEQVRGEMVGPTTDIFAAGIVLWELLTGRDLFASEAEFDTLRKVVEHEAAPPSVYATDLTEEFDNVVLKALEKDPRRRFQSARDFGKKLLSVSKKLEWGSGDPDMLGKVTEHALARS